MRLKADACRCSARKTYGRGRRWTFNLTTWLSAISNSVSADNKICLRRPCAREVEKQLKMTAASKSICLREKKTPKICILKQESPAEAMRQEGGEETEDDAHQREPDAHIWRLPRRLAAESVPSSHTLTSMSHTRPAHAPVVRPAMMQTRAVSQCLRIAANNGCSAPTAELHPE